MLDVLGELPLSAWIAMPPSAWRVLATRLLELVMAVELVMVIEFGTDELKQG